MDRPQRIHHYENILMDSARWDSFKPRDNDIIISTPYKAGTTWTQRICSLLLFPSTELDSPITAISPWVDAKFASVDEVMEIYAQQTHRRFIKTHTPLTGLPYYEKPIYLICARDPRDIFVSMENHNANLDPEKFAELLSLSDEEITGRPTLPTDVNDRFTQWLTKGSFEWEDDGFPLWSAFHHLQSFWTYRELGNIHFIHYNDLKTDLDGEMRRLARLLGIEIQEERWPSIVEAASFSSMKRDSKKTAPNAQKGLLRDPAKFFNHGTSGQWQDVLSDESLELYEIIKSERLEPSLAEWIDQRPHDAS